MMLSRLAVLAPVFAMTFGLAACNDDGSTDDVVSDAESVEETERGCKAKVKVTGDVKAKWKAEGLTILQDGSQAFYKTSDKKLALSVFPASDDVPATAVFTADGDNYTTQDDSGLVEADADGSGAKVKATATGVEAGSSVKVKATITCES